MPPKRGRGRPRKRVTPETMDDVASAHIEPQRAESQQSTRLNSNERMEMEALRARNQALEEEIARGKAQASVTSPPQPPATVPRRMAMGTVPDEGVSIQDFLRLKTPEFGGEEGEDPQEFLEETEKMVRRLPYSDARAIELVGITMKGNAWDWYQRHIEDKLYQGHPPTWEEFKRAVLDEFLTPAE